MSRKWKTVEQQVFSTPMYKPTGRRTYFAIMLPGIARLSVCDRPLPRVWNSAVGLDVSSSALGGAWWTTTARFLFCDKKTMLAIVP